jgi:hypothetical protein
MAEGILPADLAALLQSELARAPVAPPGRPPGVATIAELLQAKLFDPNASTADLVGPPPQPIPTLGGGRRPPLDIGQFLEANRVTPPRPDTSVAQPLRTEPQPITPGQEFLLEMTGLPSAHRATQQFQAARETGDPMQAVYGAGNLALAAAPYAAGPVVGRGVQAVRNSPTLAGFLAAGAGAGGLAAATEPTPVGAQRRPLPTDAIREEQRTLARDGFYQGTIDGIDGDETQRARAAAAAARRETERREREQRERDEQRALEAARTDADRERIRLDQEKLKAEREAAERAAEIQRQGSKRLQEVGEPGWFQNWGPMLAFPFGMAMGYFGRNRIGRYADKNAQTQATRADTLAADFGTGDLPTRIGRVNQFYTEGAPGRSPPFTFQAGQQPVPWSTNPAAPAADELYRRSFSANYGPGAATIGPGLVEFGVGHLGAAAAQHRIEAAERAIQEQGPTEANIQALLAARRDKALFESLDWFGRGTTSGGVVSELKSRLTRPNIRPSIGRAEAERGQIDIELSRPTGRKPTGTSVASRYCRASNAKASTTVGGWPATPAWGDSISEPGDR